MSTITAQTPSGDKATTATASPAAVGLESGSPERKLWQVPVFLAGVGVLLAVCVGRPFASDPASRQLDHELDAVRQQLSRPDGDVKAALDHARKALDRADAFPGRQGEAYFLLGSAEMRFAERAPTVEGVELWKGARLKLEEADRLGVPEGDRGRLQYRLARSRFYTGEDPQRVADQLASAVDMADDRAEGYRLLTETYLRLPPTQKNLELALAANERMRMVFPIAPELQARAQLQAGELNVRLGKSEAARKILEKIGDQAPAGIRAQKRVMLARSFEGENRFQEAADQWKLLLADTQEQLVERGPPLYHLGMCLARLNQKQEAAPFWEECLKVGKGDEIAAAALALADIWLQDTTPEKAIEPLTRAMTGVAGNWTNPLVDLKHARDRLEQAVQKYREMSRFELALRRLDLYQPVAVPVRTILLRGDICAEWAKARRVVARQIPAGEARVAEEDAARQLFGKAAAAYLLAADEAPIEAREDALWLAAICRLEAGDDREAVRALNLYVQRGKNSERIGEAWFRLGECHRKNPEPAAQANAEAAYKKCIQSQSGFELRARYQLALLMIARGALDDAEAALEQNRKRLHTDPDQEVLEKTLFALGGLYFQRNNYRAAYTLLGEALHVDQPSTTPESSRARYQLAESCRQLADQEQRKMVDGPRRMADEVSHIQKEYRGWLLKAADEYQELAHFLDKPESTGHLTPEERIQIPFLASICRFNLGEYESALEMYAYLARRLADVPRPTPDSPESAAMAARYPQLRLEALAGMVRCQAALGRGGEVRKIIDELRSVLPTVDDATRQEYEKWLERASRSLQTP